MPCTPPAQQTKIVADLLKILDGTRELEHETLFCKCTKICSKFEPQTGLNLVFPPSAGQGWRTWWWRLTRVASTLPGKSTVSSSWKTALVRSVVGGTTFSFLSQILVQPTGLAGLRNWFSGFQYQRQPQGRGFLTYLVICSRSSLTDHLLKKP